MGHYINALSTLPSLRPKLLRTDTDGTARYGVLVGEEVFEIVMRGGAPTHISSPSARFELLSFSVNPAAHDVALEECRPERERARGGRGGLIRRRPDGAAACSRWRRDGGAAPPQRHPPADRNFVPLRARRQRAGPP